MIKLEVEDYCHHCQQFTSKVKVVDNSPDTIPDRIITCERIDTCRCMCGYIKKQISSAFDD